jgi:hypothetical protein
MTPSTVSTLAFGLMFLGFAPGPLGAARADEPRSLSKDPATQAVTMSVNGKTCWSYVPQSPEGKPYFHPLAIPGTGDVFTSHRPPDHNWHLGFWFSWKFINGCNFWEPDTNGVTRVLAQQVDTADDLSLSAEATLAYLAKGKEAVREKRTVRVTTQPSGNYTIEWDSTFTAVGGEAVFSTTPVKKDKEGKRWATGGYAGLMLRFADSPAFAYTFANDGGQADVLTCGEKSAKMEVAATCKASGARAKITVSDHPDNPRHPSPWFARHSLADHKGRGYYLVGPSMVFHEPLTLPAGQSLRFRYTVTVERLP